MLQIQIQRKSRRSLARSARRASESAETSSAPAAHIPRTQETFAAEMLPHRESPAHKSQRTSPRAPHPPTNCAPLRRIPTPSAAIPNKADCAYKHKDRKSPATRSCAHAPKPAPESEAPEPPQSRPAPWTARSAAPAKNKPRQRRNPSGTRIRRAICDHSPMRIFPLVVKGRGFEPRRRMPVKD